MIDCGLADGGAVSLAAVRRPPAPRPLPGQRLPARLPAAGRRHRHGRRRHAGLRLRRLREPLLHLDGKPPTPFLHLLYIIPYVTQLYRSE